MVASLQPALRRWAACIPTHGFTVSISLNLPADSQQGHAGLLPFAVECRTCGVPFNSTVLPAVEGVRVLGRRLTYLTALCLAICGCADPPHARYVYQDADFGVVGIPQNTIVGKIDYRAEAEQLMARHFPAGYEVVRAEEVIEGQTTREHTKKTEIDASPNVGAMHQWIVLGKLGRTTSYDEKDQLQLHECRIIYKRKPAGLPGPSGQFALAGLLEPRYYVDPNQALRHAPATSNAAKTGPASQAETGTAAAQASGSSVH